VLGQIAEGLVGARNLDRLEPALLEEERGKAADIGLVVDDDRDASRLRRRAVDQLMPPRHRSLGDAYCF